MREFESEGLGSICCGLGQIELWFTKSESELHLPHAFSQRIQPVLQSLQIHGAVEDEFAFYYDYVDQITLQ